MLSSRPARYRLGPIGRGIAPAVLVAGWAAGFLLGPAPVSAQNRDRPGAAEAEALIREARDLRTAGKDARAFPLLLKAYEIHTTPRTAAQLGLVEMQLGYWLESERHLAESLSAPRDPWIASNREALETSLTKVRSAIGEIVVTGTPAGASVLVNGWEAGKLPLPAPIRVGEGPVKIEFRAAGYTPLRRSLTAAGGQRQEMNVSLERARDQPPPTAQDQAGGAVGSLAAVADPPPAPRGAWLRPAGWTAAAAGLTALGFGVYQTVSWRSEFDRFESFEASRVAGQPASIYRDCGVASPNRGAPGCDRIYRDLQKAERLAVVGYVAGAVLAAGAVTAFLVAPESEHLAFDVGTTRVRVACGLSPAVRTGSCQFLF